jgi:hypothetical protein
LGFVSILCAFVMILLTSQGPLQTLSRFCNSPKASTVTLTGYTNTRSINVGRVSVVEAMKVPVEAVRVLIKAVRVPTEIAGKLKEAL